MILKINTINLQSWNIIINWCFVWFPNFTFVLFLLDLNFVCFEIIIRNISEIFNIGRVLVGRFLVVICYYTCECYIPTHHKWANGYTLLQTDLINLHKIFLLRNIWSYGQVCWCVRGMTLSMGTNNNLVYSPGTQKMPESREKSKLD